MIKKETGQFLNEKPIFDWFLRLTAIALSVCGQEVTQMNTAQYTHPLAPPESHILPSGFLSGFVLFSALWMAPVLTLIVIAYK